MVFRLIRMNTQSNYDNKEISVHRKLIIQSIHSQFYPFQVKYSDVILENILYVLVYFIEFQQHVEISEILLMISFNVSIEHQKLDNQIISTFIFNCGVIFSSGESILGGGVCDLSSVSNGSPSERSSPFLGLCKINKRK